MSRDDYRGQTRIMNNGLEATIIEFRDFYDIDVMLCTGFISGHQKYQDFQRCDAAALGFPTYPISNEPEDETEAYKLENSADFDEQPLFMYDYLHLERKAHV